jgi:predicted nucleic acid-binding protein
VIVVDSNVIAYSLIHGDRTLDALRVRELDQDWRVPPVWRHELANVLVTYVREGGLPEKNAVSMYLSAVSSYGSGETELDPGMIMSQAIQHRLSAYDAQYLGLARQLKVLCVTEDAAIRRAAPGKAISMREFIQMVR